MDGWCGEIIRNKNRVFHQSPLGRSDEMLSAVLNGPRDLRVKEIDEPSRPPGGVTIRVEACSICGTDVKMWNRGHRDLSYPRILGHEFVGIVEEIDDGSNLQRGERVQIWPGIACGRCDPCLRGRDNQCRNMRIIGFNMDGAFAELVTLPRESLELGGINRVPDGLDPRTATLAEPLACCINGQDGCRVGPGDRVLIVGSGPVGLMHAALARWNAADMVLLVETDRSRREMTGPVRPDHVLPGENMTDEVLNATDGEGVDVVIIAAPGVQVDQGLVRLLRAGGRISLFSGMPSSFSMGEFDLNSIHYGEFSLVGAYGCRSEGCRRALELLEDGLVDPEWMFTCHVSLDDVIEGMRHSLGRKGLKTIIDRY
jgi:L-iditol 2-dehydrogenase